MRAIVGLLGLVPACYLAFVGILWVQNIFLWVNLVRHFFSWVFCGANVFFLVDISWAKNFYQGYFLVRSELSLAEKFGIFSCWPHEKRWHRMIYVHKILEMVEKIFTFRSISLYRKRSLYLLFSLLTLVSLHLLCSFHIQIGMTLKLWSDLNLG